MSSGSKDTDGEVAAPPIGLSTDYKLLMHSCELFLRTSFGSFSCDLRGSVHPVWLSYILYRWNILPSGVGDYGQPL